MNHDNQFFTTYDETEAWLVAMGIKNYIIHEDLTVDVVGKVKINDKKLTHIPIQFGYIKGPFYANNNIINTLKGCPKEILGTFHINNNKLISLEYAPKKINNYFFCYDNPITNFENLDFDVGSIIVFTPTQNMNYLDKYKNNDDVIYINFNELKKLQALQKLNEKLNDDLSVKDVKIKHKI